MLKLTHATLVVTLGALAFVTSSLTFFRSEQAREPKKPTDFVIMPGKGGGPINQRWKARDQVVTYFRHDSSHVVCAHSGIWYSVYQIA